MFRRVDVVAAIGVSMLAACTSGQSLSQSTLPVGLSAQPGGLPAAIQPAKDCNGTHNVKVTPCPIRLTRHTKSGIVVTVSGPDVVGSYLTKLNSCYNEKFCYNAERVGSSETQWRITSGTDCGGADVEFLGVNASGTEVGYAFLKVSNHYCP